MYDKPFFGMLICLHGGWVTPNENFMTIAFVMAGAFAILGAVTLIINRGKD